MLRQPNGTEFRDIIKTWEENVRERETAAASGQEKEAENEVSTGNGIDDVIKEEATGEDNVNKQSQLLGGDLTNIDDVTASDDAGEETV